MFICWSYSKNKLGVRFFGPPCIQESIPLALQLETYWEQRAATAYKFCCYLLQNATVWLCNSTSQTTVRGTTERMIVIERNLARWCYLRCFMSKPICVCRWYVECIELTAQFLCSGWSFTLSRIDEAGRSPTQMRCIATNSGNLYTTHRHRHTDRHTLQHSTVCRRTTSICAVCTKYSLLHSTASVYWIYNTFYVSFRR